MKTLIKLLILISGLPLFANQYISLTPGSSVTVMPYNETTVYCQGTALITKLHCQCKVEPNVYPQKYGIYRDIIGLITNPNEYQTIQSCNQAILNTYYQQCHYGT